MSIHSITFPGPCGKTHSLFVCTNEGMMEPSWPRSHSSFPHNLGYTPVFSCFMILKRPDVFSSLPNTWESLVIRVPHAFRVTELPLYLKKKRKQRNDSFGC